MKFLALTGSTESVHTLKTKLRIILPKGCIIFVPELSEYSDNIEYYNSVVVESGMYDAVIGFSTGCLLAYHLIVNNIISTKKLLLISPSKPPSWFEGCIHIENIKINVSNKDNLSILPFIVGKIEITHSENLNSFPMNGRSEIAYRNFLLH